jgi:hypothetical protein
VVKRASVLVPEDRPTPEELHEWAQAKRAENSLTGVRSEDLVNEWNEQRKNS